MLSWTSSPCFWSGSYSSQMPSGAFHFAMLRCEKLGFALLLLSDLSMPAHTCSNKVQGFA